MGKLEFSCSGCSTKVFKYLSQLTRTDVVFCSLSCRNKNYQKAIPTWRHPNYKEYTYTCIKCNVDFIKNGSDFKSKSRSYCSSSCRAQHIKRKPHSAATKAKLSASACKQNKNYVSCHEYLGKGGQIAMKSSWEVKYAIWLDSRGIIWNYEPLFVLSNGYSYLPDFQLDSGDIIEIKGYMREDAQKKWDLFCADYPELNKRLIRKTDMKKLGLI